MAAIGVRTMLRSRSAAATAAKVVNGVKPTTPSPFRSSIRKPMSAHIFRFPVEMSCVSIESMFPHHTATASALLTSMLAVSARTYGWTFEGQDNTS